MINRGRRKASGTIASMHLAPGYSETWFDKSPLCTLNVTMDIALNSSGRLVRPVETFQQRGIEQQ